MTIKIRLSLQKALIGNLSKNVRGICCNWDDNYRWFKLLFYIDKEPDVKEIDLQSIILTEFECDIDDFKDIQTECIYDDKTPFTDLNKLRLVIMWRDEQVP